MHLLERVHVRQQIVQLLLREHVCEAIHLSASYADVLANTSIIGGNATHRKVVLLEDALQTGPISSARGVRRMAAVAIVVVDSASCRLLRIKSELGIALSALNFAPNKQNQRKHRTRPHGSSEQTRSRVNCRHLSQHQKLVLK